MSDSQSSAEMGLAPERPLIVQNLEFYNQTLEPHLNEDFLSGFYNNSTNGVLHHEDMGVCLRDKDTQYEVDMRRSSSKKNGKETQGLTYTTITEKKNNQDGTSNSRTILFFRGPANGNNKPPEMMQVIGADETATKEENQKIIQEVMKGYLQAQVYDPDTLAKRDEVIKNEKSPEMKKKQA